MGEVDNNISVLDLVDIAENGELSLNIGFKVNTCDDLAIVTLGNQSRYSKTHFAVTAV